MCGSVNTITSSISGGISKETHGLTHGNINEMLSGAKQYSSGTLRAGADIGTFGTAEIANKAMGGKLFDPFGGSGGSSSPGHADYVDNPAQVLAMTGGAPLLANVAMGASVEDTIAGYFGQGDFKKFYGGLSDSDKSLVDGVKNQLTSIQSNTNLRNQAVQQVVNDFPNIAAQAAQAQKEAKSAAGAEFDATTKGYIDQALNGVAAKYAAGGNLSSGAMDAASARAGAEMGMSKLGYMSGEGDKAYDRSANSGLGAWQARYNETNALRNFQNLMTQGAAGQGFSAVQASLNRTQQTNMANAGFANQQNMQNQQNQNALFGSIGSLAGTGIGAMLGGPVGAGIGGQVGKIAATSYSPTTSPTSPGNPYGSFSGEPSLNLPRY